MESSKFSKQECNYERRNTRRKKDYNLSEQSILKLLKGDEWLFAFALAGWPVVCRSIDHERATTATHGEDDSHAAPYSYHIAGRTCLFSGADEDDHDNDDEVSPNSSSFERWISEIPLGSFVCELFSLVRT